jgi:hypothetical protein
LFYSTAISSFLSLRSSSSPAAHTVRFGLDVNRILASGQLWRLVVSHVPFSTVSELAIGLSCLYEFRKFERMMGLEKFVALFVAVTTLSTSLVAGLSLSLGVAPATGPYSFIYAMLVLHHSFIPETQPRMFRFLGKDFSDKAPFYLVALPLLLSQGAASVLPGVCGTAAGWLYTSDVGGIQHWRLPAPLNRALRLVGPLVASRQPAVPRPRGRAPPAGDRDRGNGTGGNAGHGGGHTGGNAGEGAPDATPVRPLGPPPEDAIVNLMGMGFERDQVVAALAESGNSVQIAAERLLSA